MSFSRMSFEEAQKQLRIFSVPKSLLRKLALHLDTHCESNWEYLAEQLDISPPEVQWLKNTVMNNPSGSPTFHLFETYLSQRDHSLERLLLALQKIKNLACMRVIKEGYDNGVFDPTLRQMMSRADTSSLKDKCPQSFIETCNSHQCLSTPPSFHHSADCCPVKIPNCQRIDSLKMNFHRAPSFTGSFSSGSTCNSLEGMVGDSMSFTRLDSNESDGFQPENEHPVPFPLAICCKEYGISSIDSDRFKDKTSFANDLDKTCGMADVVLDLSRDRRAAGGEDKLKHGCCHDETKCGKNGYRNGLLSSKAEHVVADGPPCTIHCRADDGRSRNQHEFKCFQVLQHQELRDGSHGQQCFHGSPAHLKPVKKECVKKEMDETEDKVVKNGGNMWKEQQQQQHPSGNMACSCMKNTSNHLCVENGVCAGEDGSQDIYMRDTCPQCPSFKRNTHPISKEDEKVQEMRKNSGEATTSVRSIASSYAVIERTPFKKDSRYIRIFVTYADDSKKHMKKVMQLCECLKKNNFSVSLDVRESKLLSQDKMGWYDKRFKVADYILVLISPKYYSDVTEPEKWDKMPKDESALNTLYIHRCMQAEYMQNNCLNKRFIPVLMPGSTKNNVPVWLRNTTIYAWPDQYKNLFFYMMYPAQVISEFVQRERSARTPTIQQASH